MAFAFDRPLTLWAKSWPPSVREALGDLTRYGESDWILWPSLALFVITAAVALVVRWKLMRTLLWQFASLYAFFFVGVALPGILSSILKGIVGRGRPMHLDEFGTLVFHPNLTDWTFQSFPSGHSTTAFALAAVIGFVAPRWFLPALVIAIGIGVSRVSLGVHYTSDVVSGAILGLFGAYLARLLFASRRWMFEVDADGRIQTRPMSSLKRYLSLKRRGSAPAPQTDQP